MFIKNKTCHDILRNTDELQIDVNQRLNASSSEISKQDIWP